MLSVITLLLEFIFLAILKIVSTDSVDNIVVSILILIFSFSFVITIQNSNLLGNYSSQIICGYLIRLGLLFFDIFGKSIRALPQSVGDSDSFYYNAMSLALYRQSSRPSSFARLMSVVFSIIGINRLYGQFLVMLLSMLAIIVFVYIVDDLSIKSQTKWRTSWIVCLLPNFALLSSLFLRESIVTLIITVSILFMIKWMQGKNNLYSFIAIAFSMTACLFHSGSIGITIGCLICLLIYDNVDQKIHTSIGGVLLTGCMAFIAAFLFLRYGDSLLGKFVNVNSIADIANTSSAGGSSYARYVGNSNNPVNMMIFTLPRIIYFLFSPFPWQWRGPADIFAFFFSGLFYLITIKNTIIYLKSPEATNRSMIICLLVIAFFCTFIFAWGVSNTGTASRHRDKMVCLYGVIFALSTDTNLCGTENSEERKYIKR